MGMIRPLLLKDNLGGDLISTTKDELLRIGILYVHKKTESMTESQFDSWLKEKFDDQLSDQELMDIANDPFKPEFAYLQRLVDEDTLMVARSKALDVLFMQNGMIDSSKYKYIIEDI